MINKNLFYLIRALLLAFVGFLFYIFVCILLTIQFRINSWEMPSAYEMAILVNTSFIIIFIGATFVNQFADYSSKIEEPITKEEKENE